MPVYRRHRLVHIHIPKTGGTAIEQSFAEFGRVIPAGVDRHWAQLVQGAGRREANFLVHVRPQHHLVSCEPGRLELLGYDMVSALPA